MAHIGLNPKRLRTEFMSGADGNLLAEYTDDFSQQINALGPLGKSEGLDANLVRLKLEAARKLVPYARLVEREKLRVPVKSKQAYTEFFQSNETNTLFDDLFADKLAIGQILLLLGEKPLSSKDISARLGLKPSEVARFMIESSRHGMVQYDTDSNCYALVSENRMLQ